MRFVAMTRASYKVLDRYREKLSEKAAREGHESIEDLQEAYKDKIAALKHESTKSNVATSIPSSISGVASPSLPSLSQPLSPSQQEQIPASKPMAVNEKGPNLGWTHPEGTGHPRTIGNRKDGKDIGKAKVKSLGQILDLRKVYSLPVSSLEAIWRLRYASDPMALCAMIPATTYTAMEALAHRCPQFVLPVPRTIDIDTEKPDQPLEAGSLTGSGSTKQRAGAEIHFLQWMWDKQSNTSTVLFTHLASYKAHGEYAVPHTTITHHLDLMDSKSVVLMQGQVVDRQGVSPQDAKWLVMCLQRFYTGWGLTSEDARDENINQASVDRARKRRQLLEWFSTADKRFTIERLIEETERMG